MKKNYFKSTVSTLAISLLIGPTLSYAQSVSGTQTRTVVCHMRENGSAPVTVDGNLCPQPQPAASQPCSVNCGGGPGGGSDGGSDGGNNNPGYDADGDGQPDNDDGRGDKVTDNYNGGDTSSSGGGGGGGGCFAAGTLVEMSDGTEKKIEDIKLGDIVKNGGRVLGAGSLFSYELYNYKGVQVSGSHAVFEDGVWIRVRDSKHAVFVTDEETVVYVHSNEFQRIIINGITFADFTEVGFADSDIHDIYHDALLKILNEKEQLRNVA